MAFASRPRCRKCRSKKFVQEHPTERPKCAECGTYTYGPHVARWQGRWRRRFMASLLALTVLLGGMWVLREVGVFKSCPHRSLQFVCELGGI